MSLTEEISALQRRIPPPGRSTNAATVTEAFPDETYQAFLNEELTTAQFVAAMVEHVKQGTGAAIHEA
jgi:hypothetical protein